MQEKATQANEILESPVLLKNRNYLQDFQLLLIGVEENNPITSKKDRGKMLLNPINYIIKRRRYSIYYRSESEYTYSYIP